MDSIYKRARAGNKMRIREKDDLNEVNNDNKNMIDQSKMCEENISRILLCVYIICFFVNKKRDNHEQDD